MKSYHFSFGWSILIFLAFAFTTNPVAEEKNIERTTEGFEIIKIENIQDLDYSIEEYIDILKKDETVSEDIIEAFEKLDIDVSGHWQDRGGPNCGNCYPFYQGCSSNKRQHCSQEQVYVVYNQVKKSRTVTYYRCC